jgi:hypothetical protein
MADGDSEGTVDRRVISTGSLEAIEHRPVSMLDLEGERR